MGFNAVLAAAGGARNYMARRQVDKRVFIASLNGNLSCIGNNCSYNSSSSPTFISGAWGQALSFTSGLIVQYYVQGLDLSGDFTIEAWGQGNNGWNATFATVGALNINSYGGNSNWQTMCSSEVAGTWGIENANAGGTPPAWNYVTITRNNGVLRLFKNGTFSKIGNATDTANFTGARIITFSGNGGTFALSNLRVISGISLYTGGSTVPIPTAPFTGYEAL